jgi:hypothetical protein
MLMFGCTSNKTVIPAGQDPDALVAAIAKRGQGACEDDAPNLDKSARLDWSTTSESIVTAGSVFIATCLAVPALLGCLALDMWYNSQLCSH